MGKRTSKTAEAKPVAAKLGPDNPFYAVIEDAYRVFDRPTPAETGVCTGCCMDEEIEADFFNPPVERLPLSYVRDWFFAAYDPADGVPKPTWAYLLPRILEVLACAEDVASVGLEVSLARFDTGKEANWTPEQWKVLDAFQRLYLEHQLKRIGPFASASVTLDDVLCMFGLGGWPMDNLFDQLEQADSAAIAERLYLDWTLEHYRETGGIWITAFWDAAGRQRAWQFYTSKALHERMAALALADETAPQLAEKAYCVAATIAMHAEWS